MVEILWLGRGGQGAFTAAKLLGAAYIQKSEKHYALAFPSFGPERRGAPIRAFTKLDTSEISDRSENERNDFVVILDDTLYEESLLRGLKRDGKILINSTKKYDSSEVVSIDVNASALEILNAPITNTAMLGVLGALLDELSAEHFALAIKDYMPERLWEKNIRLLNSAYEQTQALAPEAAKREAFL